MDPSRTERRSGTGRCSISGAQDDWRNRLERERERAQARGRGTVAQKWIPLMWTPGRDRRDGKCHKRGYVAGVCNALMWTAAFIRFFLFFPRIQFIFAARAIPKPVSAPNHIPSSDKGKQSMWHEIPFCESYVFLEILEKV